MYYPENSPSTVVLNVGLTGPYIVTLEEESVVSKLMVLASEIKLMMLELKAIVSKIIDAGACTLSTCNASHEILTKYYRYKRIIIIVIYNASYIII